MNLHNHGLKEYESNANEIKRNCKTIAKYSQSNLRQIFDDVTRNLPFASEVSFREVESSMYHARRMLQPRFFLQLQNYVLCCLQRLLETTTSFL